MPTAENTVKRRASEVIRRAYSDTQALEIIDGKITQQLNLRRKRRESIGFIDASIYAQGSMGFTPEALRSRPGHLSYSQQQVYNDFVRFPWQNRADLSSKAVPSGLHSSSGGSIAAGQLNPGFYSAGLGAAGSAVTQPFDHISEEMDPSSAQLLRCFILMELLITVVTRCGGYWECTPNGGDLYIGGEVMPFSVDRNITYEQFMQIVYAGYGINPTEESIKAKAIFVDCAQVLGMPQTAASINTESSFRAFMNVANTAFINARGHCYLYLTKEPVYGGEHFRPQRFSQRSTEGAGATMPQFRSSGGSNQFSGTIPASLAEQAQFYNECNYIDVGVRFEEYNSPPMQNEEPHNVEPNVPQPGDDATTTDRGVSPPRRRPEEQQYDDHEYQYRGRNVVDEEEYEATEDIGACGAYRNSSTTIPSASNQYIREMPSIPPSTYMPSDALSSSGSGDVSVRQIYSTKQELRDRLSMMAIRNHFQYKICKSNTTRFVAKCVDNGCKWRATDAYRESEFAKYMDSLRIMHPIEAKYLEDEVGLHRWARARFPSRRYDMQTTNITESMNSVLRHARVLPIIPLAEFVRSLVQR
ncbi:Transcription regulator [Melia azedarach]|uniref:Transcription regulator n=1 Tax=Melia azedarach TaxID=155640 RepID=A0ACC1X6R7_MELAZ|nr:Transcription regulator [Melia azedarach]